MSKIQEFIDAWNTAVDVEITTAQSEIDAYLAARQTAIALTDPFTLKMPKMDVLGISDSFTIDGFDVTTLGQLFDWSYPASGPKNYSVEYTNYRSNTEIVEDYVDRKYDRDDNLITPTSLYTEGYTYATMSYLAEQYEAGLRTHLDLYNILKSNDSGFLKLEASKKLKNLGGKSWFDSWMHSLYRVIYNIKISVSKLKYKDYSSLFMRIEDELDEYYLKGFYSSGTRFPLGIGEQSKYFLAVLEAGDGFFPSQTSGTQSGTQSSVNTDYTLSVINPLSDIEKKVEGKIVFIESGNYIIPNSTLNGLPNPWTNPKTNVVVPNNTGTITFNGGKSTSSKNNLATDAILALQNIIEGTYGLAIYLKYTEPDGPPVVPPSDELTGSSASAITGASESSVPGPTVSTVGTQEFTFNVEQLDIFSNADFGNLFIIGQEDETLLYDDGTDIYGSEYIEDEFVGQDEFAAEETSYKLDYVPTEADKQSEVTETNSLSGPVEIPKPKDGEMTISVVGLKKLQAHEGSRSTIYDDGTGKSIESYDSCKGFPTIGVGHLIGKNERTIFAKYLKPGKMSDSEIQNLLLKDLASRIKDLNKKLKVKVTQGQFEALLSMGFNTGFGNKSFLKAIALTNEGKKQDAANQINSGPKTSKGKELAGLVRRRKDESASYLA